MGICRDNVTNYLSSFGYNIVRLPSSRILPLQLIGRQKGSTGLLGGLDKLITTSPGPLPTIIRDAPHPDMAGRASSKMTAKIGLPLLSGFLSALGAAGSVNAQYADARRVEFQFGDVTGDSVQSLDVGEYLRDGDVNEGNVVLAQYVLGNGDLFVITETLKAREILVSAEAGSAQGMDLDVAALQNIVGGKVSVARDSVSQHVLHYQGQENLVFGFKAYCVGVMSGELTLVQAGPDRVALVIKDGEQQAGSRGALLAENGLLDLESLG